MQKCGFEWTGGPGSGGECLGRQQTTISVRLLRDRAVRGQIRTDLPPDVRTRRDRRL